MFSFWDFSFRIKSILSLLTLAAGFNTQLTLIVNGKDEDKAIDVLGKLLEEGA